MGFNRDNYRRIKHEYDGKNVRAKEDAQRRAEELHAKYPEIRDIDNALQETGLKILDISARCSGSELENRLALLRNETYALRKERNACLEYYGIPADYSDVKYECPECCDTGFVGIRMCRCMREKLIAAGYESSGIGSLIKTKTFDNFDPGFQKHDPRAYEMLSADFAICRNYAENFDCPGSGNLLLMGNTGLGKTHLSAAIAGRVIDRGFDAVCETAQNVFSDFEFERFNRPYGTGGSEPQKTDKYFECDLLIIDDLGTEMANQFTVSCLYNLINTRLNHGRPMIINTNLSRDELRKRYADRITSRLFGEFSPLCFLGRDVREQKLG